MSGGFENENKLEIFQIVNGITNVESIAQGKSIRGLARLQDSYGGRSWKKLTGIAMVFEHGCADVLVEIHWYEAHGVGKLECMIKEYL